MGSAQSFSEWLTEDRFAEAYRLRSSGNSSYGLFCDSSARETYAPCNCNDCARFKRAADQMDDVQCWTDDDVSDSIVEAQKSLWRTRKALHKLHMPELYLMDTPITILAHRLTRTARIGLEWKELGPCSCDKCSTLIRRYREIEEAHEDGGDGNEYIRGLTLVVAAQTRVHSDVPFSVESDDDEPESEPIEDLEHSSLSPADDGDNEYDEHAQGAEATKLFTGTQKKTCESGTTDITHVMHGGHHNKFMVCDHCMGHGLPRNEASVCDQCQLFEQPCVHRWCRDSPMSKYLCGNNDCRYAHRDSVVARDDDPRWIVLPGKLTPYLSKARIASKTFSFGGGWDLSDEEEHSRRITLDEKQEEAVDELRVGIAAGEGTMLTMRFSCSCELESCDGQTEQDLKLTFGEPLPRHSKRPQLGGQLAYLNHFIPTAIESEQSSYVTTDSEDQNEKEDDEDEDEEETSSSQGTDSEDEEEDEQKQDIDDRDLDLDDLRDGMVSQRAPLCPHCSKRNDYYSVSPCNHRTCIECALTLRLGRGDRTCIECGDHADVVWFTASEHKDFQELEDIRPEEGVQGIFAFDGDSDILFENAVIRKDTMWLLDQLPDVTVSRGGETAAFYFM